MVFAVLADVLVVRILLGTAVMTPLGRAAWWAPGPPARFYERFGIEEGDLPADDTADERVPVAAG
jgi:trehalose monomycolate/heme transporter